MFLSLWRQCWRAWFFLFLWSLTVSVESLMFENSNEDLMDIWGGLECIFPETFLKILCLHSRDTRFLLNFEDFLRKFCRICCRRLFRTLGTLWTLEHFVGKFLQCSTLNCSKWLNIRIDWIRWLSGVFSRGSSENLAIWLKVYPQCGIRIWIGMGLEPMEPRFMISIDLDTAHRCLDIHILDTTQILTRNSISCLLSRRGLRLPPVTTEYVVYCGREFGFRN